jgi:hypothetical protein
VLLAAVAEVLLVWFLIAAVVRIADTALTVFLDLFLASQRSTY